MYICPKSGFKAQLDTTEIHIGVQLTSQQKEILT